MTGLALASPRFVLPLAGRLLDGQRALALYGLALAALACLALMLQAVDPRTLASGVGVWVKPAKFLASVGLFALTAAWYFGHVRPERRSSRPMRVTAGLLILAGSFELVWIGWQGANGLESHFNLDTPYYRTMFSLMGLFAVLLVATTLPLAWEIARRPAPGLSADFAAALVVGLVLTFALGGGFGGAIAANGGHAVGPEAGAVPLVGWNRSGGDLRIAHFLGIHAQQAIPLLAFLVRRRPAPTRWLVLLAGVTAYVALAFACYAQAAAGRPLFPL